jgi:hypothetical protein
MVSGQASNRLHAAIDNPVEDLNSPLRDFTQAADGLDLVKEKEFVPEEASERVAAADERHRIRMPGCFRKRNIIISGKSRQRSLHRIPGDIEDGYSPVW